jgi:hypothetical protein
MVPNNILLQLAVIPMREPDPVELRVRVPAEVTPAELQESLVDRLSVETRYPPHVELEELDDDKLSVIVRATPRNPSHGGRLAAEIVAAMRAGRRNLAVAS